MGMPMRAGEGALHFRGSIQVRVSRGALMRFCWTSKALKITACIPCILSVAVDYAGRLGGTGNINEHKPLGSFHKSGALHASLEERDPP